MRLLVDVQPLPPALGLAIDEILLESTRENGSETIRVWANDRSVIVGRSQAVAAEVDEDRAAELGIPVLRRLSGGGAVVHYPGNLNLTVAFRRRTGLSDVAAVFAGFGHALARGLGGIVPGVAVEENGLYVDGLKVGGAAQARRGSVVLYHTTLMVESPEISVERLLQAMRPGYRADGVASRPRRMTSLADATGRHLHLDDIGHLLANALALALDARLTPSALAPSETARADELSKEKYGSDRWNRSR